MVSTMGISFNNCHQLLNSCKGLTNENDFEGSLIHLILKLIHLAPQVLIAYYENQPTNQYITFLDFLK